jgi:ABC-type sugar transport system substrate-binding protein
VALVLKTLNHPFFVDMRRGAQEAADRLGVTLQVQAAEREIDVEKQMQIVENLIQTGIRRCASRRAARARSCRRW